MVVVLPVPLTPRKRITYGFGWWVRIIAARDGPGFERMARTERSSELRTADSRSAPHLSFLPARLRLRSEISRSATGRATSDCRRAISSCSVISSREASRIRRPRRLSVNGSAEGTGGASGGGAAGPEELSDAGAAGSAGERRSRDLIAAHIRIGGSGRHRLAAREGLEALGEPLDAVLEGADLTLELAGRGIDPGDPLGQGLDHLLPGELDGHSRPNPDQHRRPPLDRTSDIGLSPQGDQELPAGLGPLDPVEGSLGPFMVHPGRLEHLELGKHRVELATVGVQPGHLLLGPLFDARGGGGAHAAGASRTSSIRTRVRLTWWQPPSSERIHSRAADALGASHCLRNTCQ